MRKSRKCFPKKTFQQTNKAFKGLECKVSSASLVILFSHDSFSFLLKSIAALASIQPALALCMAWIHRHVSSRTAWTGKCYIILIHMNPGSLTSCFSL
jgi:hypothetical protein